MVNYITLDYSSLAGNLPVIAFFSQKNIINIHHDKITFRSTFLHVKVIKQTTFTFLENEDFCMCDQG